MRSIALKLPEDLARQTGKLAQYLKVSRAAYIRMAIQGMNRTTDARLRGKRLAEISRRVRRESMKVNAEFAAFERSGGCQR